MGDSNLHDEVETAGGSSTNRKSALPSYLSPNSKIDDGVWETVPYLVRREMNQLNTDKENLKVDIKELEETVNAAQLRIQKLKEELRQANSQITNLGEALQSQKAESHRKLEEKEEGIRNLETVQKDLEQERNDMKQRFEDEKKERAAEVLKNSQEKKEWKEIESKLTDFLRDAKAHVPDMLDLGGENLSVDFLLLCCTQIEKKLQAATNYEEILAASDNEMHRFWKAYWSFRQGPTQILPKDPTGGNVSSSQSAPPQNAYSQGSNSAEEGIPGDAKTGPSGSAADERTRFSGGVVCQGVNRSGPEANCAENSGSIAADVDQVDDDSQDSQPERSPPPSLDAKQRRSRRATKQPDRLFSSVFNGDSSDEDILPGPSNPKRQQRSSINTPGLTSTAANLRDNQYRCRYCPGFKKITGFQNYKFHLRESHRAINAKLRIACTNCGTIFSSRVQLNAHKRNEHDWKKKGPRTPTCKRVQPLPNGNAHGAIPPFQGSGRYYCAACEKTYSNRDALNQHVNEQVFGKAYGCRYCSWSSNRASQVKQHVKNRHPYKMLGSGGNIISCTYCKASKKSFFFSNSERELKNHCIQKHNIISPIAFK